MTVYNHGKFQAGGEWRTPSVFYSPYLVDQITLRVTTGDATITIDSLIEFIAGDIAATDLKTATICGDESIVCVAQVLNNTWNQNQLAVNNTVGAVDSYHELTKGTAMFNINIAIDVILLFPGMVMNTKLANSQVMEVGDDMIASALGKAKLFATGVDNVEAKLGKCLSVATSVASLQWVAMVTK